MRQTPSDPDVDSWWICEFYDKDTLPIHLDIKLRVNRRDLALADSHGQIWLQLVSIRSSPYPVFHRDKWD
ncbi:hypothetical protein BGZ61DRAFT_461020 [Ilyonectria robusta]|uniref:uncharacterized protein n=1 Tax=Ilyonectria robusta TaxID=1079257 RepID=UPI001E8D2DB8|nr:uncharacterized protein BGZ61DRAFT_461020 [Ilyonectria robusta]KAH8669420.1 hypothetical protein BGZ61DRAFT_461020 [Ilyonectria robusta]